MAKLPLERKVKRETVHLSMRIGLENDRYLQTLCELYNRNRREIIEAMIETYAPAIIRDAEQEFAG